MPISFEEAAGTPAGTQGVSTAGSIGFHEALGVAPPERNVLQRLGDFVTDPAEQKTFLQTLGSQAGSVGKFVAALPAMAVGGVAGGLKQVEELVKTGDTRKAAKEGLETFGRVSEQFNVVSALEKVFGYKPDETVIDTAMNAINRGIVKYGDVVEAQYGTPSEATQLFLNQLMALGGGKGSVKAVQAGVKKALAPKAEGVPGAEVRTSYDETAPEESVASLLKVGIDETVIDSPKQVADLFAAAKKNRVPEVSDTAAVDSIFAKARARGLAEVGPKTPEQAIAESKTRIAEGLTLEEARAKVDAENTPPPELTALDTAIQKTRAGRAFDLTAEEKISLDHSIKVRAGKILDHNGRPFERGSVDPDLLKGILAAGGVAAYVATHPEDTELLTGIAGVALLGIKAKGEGLKGLLEADLLKRIEAGGKDAQAATTELYRQAVPKAQRTLERKFGHTSLDLGDIMSEATETSFRALAEGTFRGESAFSSFLTGNAIKDALNALDKMKRRGGEEVSLQAPVGDDITMLDNLGHNETPANLAMNRDLGAQIETALGKIDPKFKDAFLAVEAEGLSYDAAAERFQVPVGTIRSRVSRAKEALQGYLRDYKDGEAGFDEAIPDHSKGPLGSREGGAADPQLLARLGAVALGATVGSQLTDNKLLGAVVGGLGLGAAMKIKPREAAATIKNAFAADTRIRINQFADAHEAGIARAARATWQQASAVARDAPKLEDRVALTHMIQGGREVPAHLVAAARRAKEFFAALGEQGQQAGVLKGLIDNYVTNLWDLTGKNKDAWEAILNKAGGPSMSPESRFALRRRITNLAEGKRLGLVPLTEDVAQIMSIYGNALARTMENKKLLQALRNVEDPATGMKLLQPSQSAPHSYGVIDHPQMHGVRIHPDIVPSLRCIFDNADPGVVARGLEGLNTAIKRSAVSFSLFHAKALVDAQVGAHGMVKGIPLAAKGIAQATAPKLFGENAFLRQLREGGAGDLIDQAQSAGLKISMEKGKLADEDIGGSFYSALTGIQRGLDSIIPGAGKPLEWTAKINHVVDTFMWERLHAGMKLGTFASKLEVLRNADAKAAARERRAVRSEEELAKQAASFTNDIYGGLNWRHLAEEARTKWGRDIALAAYSPKGRRVSQLLLFAPDWTVSTTRAATRTAGELLGYEAGSGLRGLREPQNATDLHRQYMLRSAAYYFVVGDAINYALSGHHLWSNEDPTRLDMGDGRTMQWSKHSMEPVHWVTNTGQQALNKLGFLPKEAANQLLGSEYLSAKGFAPKMDTSLPGRVSHVGRALAPIAAQQAFGPNAAQGGAVSGFLGAPIYGKTYAQRYTNRTPEVAARLRQRDESEAADPGLKAARLLKQRERRDAALRRARELTQ